MQFRKKPVVIEAQQWFEPDDPRHDPTMLTHRKGNTVSPPDYLQDGDLYCLIDKKYGMGPSVFMIRTGGPNSDVQVHPGDWIITGVRGEKYPCKDEIFRQTYEPIG